MLCNSIILCCLELISIIGQLVAMLTFNVRVNLCDRLTFGHIPIKGSLGFSLEVEFLRERLRMQTFGCGSRFEL